MNKTFEEHMRTCNTDRMLLVAKQHTRFPADYRDIYQEALMKAWEHTDSFRGESTFETWISRIIINAAHYWDTKEARNPEAEVDIDEIGEYELGFYSSPEEECIAEELEQAINANLNDLSTKQLRLWQLRAQLLTFEEISELLGVEPSTVRTRYQAVLDKISNIAYLRDYKRRI